jgi:hypothetical protein
MNFRVDLLRMCISSLPGGRVLIFGAGGARRHTFIFVPNQGGREAKLLVCKEGERGRSNKFQLQIVKIAKSSILKNTHGIILMRENILLLLNLPKLNLQSIYRGQYTFLKLPSWRSPGRDSNTSRLSCV